jgi:hypothetical protein
MTEEMKYEAVQGEEVERRSEVPGVMRKLGRVLFRTLVAIIVGLAIGIGLYYGALRLYREAIEPIQGYGDRILDLERRLDLLSKDMEVESQELNDRQASIEGRLATQAEALASVEALVDAAQEDLREQRGILNAVGELEGQVEDLTLAVDNVSSLVEQFELEIVAGDLTAQRVQRTATYLRAMSLLTRAQLELDRDNYGFAAEQIAAARAIMSGLIVVDETSGESVGDEALVGLILERLDAVLLDLPSRPAVAGDGLEAVWKLFMEAVQPVQLEQPETGGE